MVRVADRDRPELGNLHRQLLYDEDDVASGLPKAVLAQRKLAAANRGVEVQAWVGEIDEKSCPGLMEDVDLVVDGLDNMETRYVLNQAAADRGIPWIWAGVLGAAGNVAVIMPGKTPCLRCLLPQHDPQEPGPTCDTVGIIGPNPSLVASLAATEALKYLAGAHDKLLPGLLSIDLWDNTHQLMVFESARDGDCPCCGRLVSER
jgi:adenylyltransferase/sulfurtransferase